MKTPLLILVLLYCCSFSHLTNAQLPSRLEYETITETEARAFMQQVLWLCNYGRNVEDKPNEHFMSFLEDSLQQLLKKQERVWYDYDLYGALISKIELPWIEVITTANGDTRNWRRAKRFKIEKKGGKLYLIPDYQKTWTSTTVRAWQESYDIPIRSATEEEKSAIREDVMAYLEHRFPEAEPVDWNREQLLGHWQIDSTYTFLSGEKISSPSLAEYLLLYDGKFYNVIAAYWVYGIDFLDYPGWWGINKNHLFISNGIQVDLLAVEEVTQHRILLKRYETYEPSFLILSNLPRQVKAVETPNPIEHPEVEVVLQPIYKYIGYFQDTLAEAQTEDYSGLIDHTGAEWLPLVYDQVVPFRGRPFTYAQRQGQWYRINAQGEEVETLPYQDFIDLMGSYLLVKHKNEKVSVIDSTGALILPFEYEMVFPRSDSLFEVMKDGKKGIIDLSGQETVPPVYDDLRPMENGFYKAVMAGKQGILDPNTGQRLIEPEYEYISLHDRYYQTQRNGRLVLFDQQFREIELPDYEMMRYQEDGYLGVEQDGKRGIVDVHGQVMIPVIYENVWLTSMGVKAKQQGKWGLLDRNGEVVIPMIYEEMEFGNDLIKIQKDGYWGLLDPSGREILPAVYDELQLDRHNQPTTYCKIYENGKARLIDLDGAELIPATYDDISFPRPLFPGSENKWYAFKDNGKRGYLNEKGEVAIPAFYDYHFFFESGGYAVAELDGKYGVIDTENKVLVPFIFDSIKLQSDQPVIVVEYKGYYGLAENPVYQKP